MGDPQQPPVQPGRAADEFKKATLLSLTQEDGELRAKGFERRSRLHPLMLLMVVDVSVAQLLPTVLSQKLTYAVSFCSCTCQQPPWFPPTPSVCPVLSRCLPPSDCLSQW